MAQGRGIAPKALDASQVTMLVAEIRGSEGVSEEVAARWVECLTHRVPPEVDEAAYVKAGYLSALAKGEEVPTWISRERAVELSGTMHGGYNVAALVDLLGNDDDALSSRAAEALRYTLLVFVAFHDVVERHRRDVARATEVLESWANADLFFNRPNVPDVMTVTVYKVAGETNTDDLSPAQDAWSRPDIPLHALAMHKNARDGVRPNDDGSIGPLDQMREVRETAGHPLA